MLRGVKGLHGYTLHASDGEIGRVDEILFDDEQWTVRYLIVDTGDWLLGRKVLVASAALGLLDWDQQSLNVNLTRDQVENSPGVDTDAPVSRQWEKDFYDNYAWPYYWGDIGLSTGMGMWGGPWYPGMLLVGEAGDARISQQAEEERVRNNETERDDDDIHLRSTKQVTGYGIFARDGHLGHVDDFIVDDETWRIRYLAVDTRDWWPGKKVLLPPIWIGQVIWPDRKVTVNVTRDQVRNGPEWDSHEPICRTFEDELSRYYARQRIVAAENPNGSTEIFAEHTVHNQ